jgi:hypothetical protein
LIFKTKNTKSKNLESLVNNSEQIMLYHLSSHPPPPQHCHCCSRNFVVPSALLRQIITLKCLVHKLHHKPSLVHELVYAIMPIIISTHFSFTISTAFCMCVHNCAFDFVFWKSLKFKKIVFFFCIFFNRPKLVINY